MAPVAAEAAFQNERPLAGDDGDRDQIVERLGWTPMQRLQYLLDMLEFEALAHRVAAHRVETKPQS